MPIPPDICRVNFNFDLKGSGADKVDEGLFSLHLEREHFTGNTTDWPADVDHIATKCRDKWVSNMAVNDVSPQVTMRDVSVYHLDTAGKTLHKGQAIFTGDKAWAGDGSGSAMPPENAICVTLYAYDPASFAPQRARKRGRFYLPPSPQRLLNSQGVINLAASAHQLTSNLNAFLNDVNGLELTGTPDAGLGNVDNMRVVVLSRTGGFATRVVAWRVDSLWDVMKSRQNRLPATADTGAVSQS